MPYRGDGDRSKSSSPPQFSKMASARSSWLLFASDANATTETMLWLFCSTISPAIVIHPPPSSRGRVSLLGRGRRVIFKMYPHEMNSSPRAAGGPFGHGWNCITTNALTLTVHVSIYHWQIGFCTQPLCIGNRRFRNRKYETNML